MSKQNVGEVRVAVGRMRGLRCNGSADLQACKVGEAPPHPAGTLESDAIFRFHIVVPVQPLLLLLQLVASHTLRHQTRVC